MIELRWKKQKPVVIDGSTMSWNVPPVLQYRYPTEMRYDEDSGKWVPNWQDVPEVTE